jgi:hypothetical protein
VYNKPHIIERAFELAKSGEHRSLDEIRAELNRESYSNVHEHLSGAFIQAQLKELISASPCLT